MFPIRAKELIAPGVTRTIIEAPKIARRRKPGQFVILRLYEEGERIPLTIVDADPVEGTITIISQRIGKSTAFLETMPASQGILDVVGPLGHPTEIRKVGHVVCIGGGIGVAPVYPIVQGFRGAQNRVTTIIGARTKELLILEEEMRSVSDELHIITDDGTSGRQGFVTDVLRELIERGERFDEAVAIGPIPMMAAVSKLTKEHEIPTMVSLNSLMVDGTGMCGACRVTVGGQTRFTCVDGPEFDGHQVDFEELAHRLNMFKEMDRKALEAFEQQASNPNCARKKGIADGSE
ncbi:sulfide/dihydroorotate dehydrogenase-like FAD/NAD-binding protein [Candidatus Latescibacterota bacterium]